MKNYKITNSKTAKKTQKTSRDKKYFGDFGGMFIPEILSSAVIEVANGFEKIYKDKDFWKEFDYYANNYIGRPSPLYFAKNLTEYLGGAKIYLKRDELNHTGSHKINNCIGQALLAKRLGKKKIIAETGAGQHGVATATVCALFGFECKIFMGAKDIARQESNVYKMKLLGAEIISVDNGAKTLCEAMNEALRYWSSTSQDTYYLIGTSAGPYPYPKMVQTFQSIIGNEARKQILKAEKKLPDLICASIGGGSNAIGLFNAFLKDKDVNLVGVEAGGCGNNMGENSASLTFGRSGVLHGNLSYYLQDDDGQISEGHSIAAGLDYPGVSPIHSYLKSINRVHYKTITDSEALNSVMILSRTEGIIPALEPSHALGYVIKTASQMRKNQVILVNLCGRGDKDLQTIMSNIKI